MSEKLLDMTAGDLLHAFGTGGHKPGSGSAAAHMGCLAAQLTCNVIDLTELYKKRSVTYQAHLGQFRSHLSILRGKIIPALDYYTEEDSAQFDKVIKARTSRNEEKDPKLKAIKSGIADGELRIATEMPLEIARYSYNVGRMAVDVFDYGYTAARGESAEGIIFAAASMLSCLSIIELNLQKIPVGAWTYKIRKQKEKLYLQQEELEKMSKERHHILKQEADEHYEYERMVIRFRTGNLENTIKSDDELESMVAELQNFLWLKKDKIFKKNAVDLNHPIHVLKPEEVLTKLMGYTYAKRESLGRHYEGTDAFEVAGLIDKRNKTVEVSKQFSPETMRFTLAHELAHALLHHGTILHRDRGIDGSHINRNPTERQADKFAALFLMPAKLVHSAFTEIFGVPVFTIDQKNVFHLGASSMEGLRRKCVDLRGLSKELVTVKVYAGKRVTPLNVIFGVSETTMAIRLEELGLVKF